ncbi:MAG: hypothetical protein ACOH18_02420 [Candidatus Saccharimonadaceae bacterium]
MARGGSFRVLFQRFSPSLRRRGTVLKNFSETLGLVNFGSVHQHDDDMDALRGFTASLTHRDTDFAVGTYNGFNIRITNRFDVIRIAGNPNHEQLWTILEVELDAKGLPHMFFIPTGHEAGEYGRLYATQPHMQPLNSMILDNHSPEFHGRFQIYASATHSHKVETLFTSPVIVGIGSRFWPHGIEVEHGKLLIYITQHRLTKTVLESTLASALWLAETIDSSSED